MTVRLTETIQPIIFYVLLVQTGESDQRRAETSLWSGLPAMTRGRDHDTSVLNASQHWTARHQNGGSANLIRLPDRLAL